MTDRSTFADDLKNIAEARRSEAHPQPDILLAYHFGTLADDQRATLQNHLATCPQCARTVLDMADFPDVELAPGVHSTEPDEQEMAELEKKIAAARPANDNIGIGWIRSSTPYLAAALALFSVGLGWRAEKLESGLDEARKSVTRLEEELARTREAGHSFEIVSLQPIGAGDVRGGPIPPPVIGSDSDPLPLVLNVYLPEDGPYSVDLVDGAGKVRHTWSGLEPTSRKNLTLMLSPSRWPAGNYELRARKSGGEPRSSLASFPITIEP